MNNKKKLIIGISIVAVLAGGQFLYKHLTRNLVKEKYGNFILEDYDESELINSEDLEIDVDSVFHSKICSDYGIAWKWYDENKERNKFVLFDSYSGKVLIYNLKKNADKSKLNIAPADNVFAWELSGNKLNAMDGFVEKDTIIYWIINEKKQQLTDEKGNVFEKIRIPIIKK